MKNKPTYTHPLHPDWTSDDGINWNTEDKSLEVEKKYKTEPSTSVISGTSTKPSSSRKDVLEALIEKEFYRFSIAYWQVKNIKPRIELLAERVAQKYAIEQRKELLEAMPKEDSLNFGFNKTIKEVKEIIKKTLI